MAGQWRSEFRVFPTLRGYRRSWLTRDLLGPQLRCDHNPRPTCDCSSGRDANNHGPLWLPCRVPHGGDVRCEPSPCLGHGQHHRTDVGRGLVSVGLSLAPSNTSGSRLSPRSSLASLADCRHRKDGVGWRFSVATSGDWLPRRDRNHHRDQPVAAVLWHPPTFERTPARLLHFLQHVSAVNVPTLIVGVALTRTATHLLSHWRSFPGALVVLVQPSPRRRSSISVLWVSKRGSTQVRAAKPHLAPADIRLHRTDNGHRAGDRHYLYGPDFCDNQNIRRCWGFETDINADFRSVGAANVLSSFFGAFTANASPPSTAIIAESRGRTQATALFASVLAVILMFASRLIEALPEATLSAILIFIAIRIFHLDEMIAMKHYSWRAFSHADRNVGRGDPRSRVWGRPGSSDFGPRPRSSHCTPRTPSAGAHPEGQWVKRSASNSEEVPGVAVFRLNGPLWFGNANWFREEMLAAIPEDSEKPDLLVLDTTGVDDIDFTGNNAVIQVAELCELRTVELAIVTHPGKTDRAFHRVDSSTTSARTECSNLSKPLSSPLILKWISRSRISTNRGSTTLCGSLGAIPRAPRIPRPWFDL